MPLHEANGMLSEPVREVNDNLNMSVNQNIGRSVPEADEEGMSVHEAGSPVESRNEYLPPLHEQEFVLNEMHSFHLEHRQCIVCNEAWPTRQNLTSEVYICYRCKRDKKSPKKFSAENDMDPGVVPEQLRGLLT